MRKTITRSITVSVIQSAKVTLKNGQAEITDNPTLKVNGIISEEKALKLVRKTYGETSQIESIETIDDVYEISVEEFMKYAKKVEVAPAEVQEGAAE